MQRYNNEAKLHLNLITLKANFRCLGIIALLFLLSGCTTQKSRRDLSMMEKVFLNTNARYNGYYNATALMDSSVLALERQHKDNYTKVLEMYKYTAADNPQAVAPDLDIAMKKVSIVVNLYRRSKWTDDCYLVVGQAQYYKQDYESAESTFRYMVGEFDPNAPKKKGKTVTNSGSGSTKTASDKPALSAKAKKKLAKQKARDRQKYNKQIKANKKKAAKAKAKGKTAPVGPTRLKDLMEAKASEKAAEEAEKKAKEEAKNAKKAQAATRTKKHKPAFQQAELWLAKTLIERENHEAAIRILNRLLENPKTYDELRREALSTEAYAFLKRKQYERALPLLEQIIGGTKEKSRKARLHYITGQLHQLAGRHSDAVSNFEQVVKLSNDYEMDFNAQLNVAISSAAATGTPATARASLEKMLKDTKNLEYKDQIYYALANLDFLAGDTDEGISNLKRSLEQNSGNQAQKAECYYKLATLFFEREDFIQAKNYYDSTLTVMATSDNRFDEAQLMAENLTEIAKYLVTIVEQDSLMKLSNMSPAARAELALKIKKEQDEARRAAALAAAQDAAAGAGSKPGKGSDGAAALRGPGDAAPALASTSTFFAYNDRELRQGARDFQRKWGSRPLEDDWRRSSKGLGTPVATDESAVAEETPEDSESKGPLTAEEIKTLLGNFPETAEEIAQAQLKIKEALFNLGKLYREKMSRPDKAIASLELLNERFPANNFELESWYLLHIMFKDLNNTERATFYANKIIEKYPTSPYGRVLQDPAYLKELRDERKQLNVYYDQTYAAFQRGEYQYAYEQSLAAREKFGAGNPLQPKFALLNAMCLGNLQGKNAYVNALNEVMSRYPNTPEQTRAREMLRLISGTSAALPGGTQGADLTDTALYTQEDNDLHYVIIYLDKAAPLDKARYKLSDYNQKYYDLDKLRVANVFLGSANEIPVLVLRRFKDKGDAMKYISNSQKNAADFLDATETPFQLLAISQNNYRSLLKDKRTDVYQEFFNNYYR